MSLPPSSETLTGCRWCRRRTRPRRASPSRRDGVGLERHEPDRQRACCAWSLHGERVGESTKSRPVVLSHVDRLPQDADREIERRSLAHVLREAVAPADAEQRDLADVGRRCRSSSNATQRIDALRPQERRNAQLRHHQSERIEVESARKREGAHRRCHRPRPRHRYRPRSGRRTMSRPGSGRNPTRSSPSKVRSASSKKTPITGTSSAM